MPGKPEPASPEGRLLDGLVYSPAGTRGRRSPNDTQAVVYTSCFERKGSSRVLYTIYRDGEQHSEVYVQTTVTRLNFAQPPVAPPRGSPALDGDARKWPGGGIQIDEGNLAACRRLLMHELGRRPPRTVNLVNRAPSELLALSRACLAELKRRGVVRSLNAPAGDYAEELVRRATAGTLAPTSQKSWDVDVSGEHLQVKARVVSDPASRSQRQLSAIRSWEFDAVVVVLFDDSFGVWKAARIPTKMLRQSARFSEHVRGDTVFATDQLLNRPGITDWTKLLRDAERRL